MIFVWGRDGLFPIAKGSGGGVISPGPQWGGQQKSSYHLQFPFASVKEKRLRSCRRTQIRVGRRSPRGSLRRRQRKRKTEKKKVCEDGELAGQFLVGRVIPLWQPFARHHQFINADDQPGAVLQ